MYVPLESNSIEPKVVFSTNLDQTDAEYWLNDAQRYLHDVLQDPRKTMKPKRAKNIIMFLGDGNETVFFTKNASNRILIVNSNIQNQGMSLSTVAATRMYMGDENKKLSFEKFPHIGLSKV